MCKRHFYVPPPSPLLILKPIFLPSVSNTDFQIYIILINSKILATDLTTPKTYALSTDSSKQLEIPTTAITALITLTCRTFCRWVGTCKRSEFKIRNYTHDKKSPLLCNPSTSRQIHSRDSSVCTGITCWPSKDTFLPLHPGWL
jgi:hypothetical protein